MFCVNNKKPIGKFKKKENSQETADGVQTVLDPRTEPAHERTRLCVSLAVCHTEQQIVGALTVQECTLMAYGAESCCPH